MSIYDINCIGSLLKNNEYPGRGIVLGIDQTGRYCAGGPQFAIPEQIQTLGQLVNDDAVMLVGSYGFQAAGTHITADNTVIIVNAFNQGIAVGIFAEHMHTCLRGVDKAALPLIQGFAAAGGSEGINGFFFIAGQYGDGAHQQFPAGFLIVNIIGEILTEPGITAPVTGQCAQRQVVLVFFAGTESRSGTQ